MGYVGLGLGTKEGDRAGMDKGREQKEGGEGVAKRKWDGAGRGTGSERERVETRRDEERGWQRHTQAGGRARRGTEAFKFN